MNNYKFRGKTADGKWAYGNIIEYGKECHIFEKENAEKDKNPLAHMPLVRPETVGQWTGLKDKNGKEIYDGDIVEITQGEATCKREVIFITAMFALRRDDMAIWICNVLPKDMEVVGNIHDNPELLEGK